MSNNKLINIEVNSEHYKSLPYRNASYIFEKYAETVKVGEDYTNMPDVIQINFTSGLPKTYPEVGKYSYMDPDTKIKWIKNLVTYEYNLDKIKELCYNGDNKYMYIAILDLEEKELSKYCEGDEYMEKFEKEVKRLNEDIEFTEFLSAEEDARKVHNTLIAEAKEEGLIEGKKEGFTQGEAKGIQKGLAQGETKGIESVAKNLLNLNYDITEISKITGLSETKINALKEN